MKPQIGKHRDLINALKNQRQMDAANAVERGHVDWARDESIMFVFGMVHYAGAKLAICLFGL